MVPSASLISNEPGAMFTIAGMVPFIPYLLGRETLRSPARPAYRSASAPWTLKRSVRLRVTVPSFRWLVTSPSVITQGEGDSFRLRVADYLSGSGWFWPDPERLGSPSTRVTKKHSRFGLRPLPSPERIQRMGMKENYWSTGQPALQVPTRRFS